MPEFDLGKVKMTDAELEDKINSIINSYLNGFSFGYSEDGKPGFKEPSGTVFVPFASEGEESLPIEQSKTYKMNWVSNGQYNAKTSSWSGGFGINPKEIKTIVLNGSVQTTPTIAMSSNAYSYLYLRGTKIGGTSESNIKEIAKAGSSGRYVTGTSKIENFSINIDEDIDWSVWDKEKQITLYYSGTTNYTYGEVNLDIELVASNSEINVFHNLLGRNYDGKGNSRMIVYNPELLKKIHLSGEIKASSQPSYLYEQACKIGSSSFTNVSASPIATVASGKTESIDTDHINVDWSVYDPAKGIGFYMCTYADTSSPGQINANITYTIG